MHIIRGLVNLRPEHRGCVATIGNFDGVHLGHQAIIRRLQALGGQLALPTLLITFEPYPQEFFAGEQALPRLSRFREKMDLLSRVGLDRVLCLRFNPALARMEAGDFVRRILVQGVGVRHLVVGDDFRFGRQRRGDFAILAGLGRKHGFAVERTPTFEIDGRRVSSTWVREALTARDMVLAARLLGRPYAIAGRVAHGDKRGRQLGFPTANIHLRRKAVPVNGVFAVTMEGLAEQPLPGVANVGSRPTVDGVRSLLEVHLFDFDREIYRRHVQVNFLHSIRPERKFDSLDALKRQIARDCDAARAYFAESTTTEERQRP